MKFPVGKLILEMIAVFVWYALLLFVPAGTLHWAAGWVFFVIYFVAGIAIVVWLMKTNPELLNERMTGLSKTNREAWDKPFVVIIILLYVVWIMVMPLDVVRFHWSHIPSWAQTVGGLILCISFYMLFVTYRENSFLSPVARIQKERGQTVISTGPYRYVRHPMYTSSMVQFIGSSLLLGSWLGLLVGLVLTGVLARRAVLEETMLRNELPGYDAYMTHVKYRLIPYIW